MDEFESEDQQVEAIKKWWKENGASLILGLGIGIAALLGWREYLAYKTDHSAEASDLYQAVQAQVVNNRLDDDHAAKADQIRAEYSDTPYAALVSMAQAKHPLLAILINPEGCYHILPSKLSAVNINHCKMSSLTS